MVFYGLTFAFTYSVVVAYASSLSNSAIRGTMQGIVTGLFDGLGEVLTFFVSQNILADGYCVLSTPYLFLSQVIHVEA